jgi:hypothetical protein
MFLTMQVNGHLDSNWSDWFEGLELQHLANGNTEISGVVIDQAALYGLLTRAQDLGLTLLSVLVEPSVPGETDKPI